MRISLTLPLEGQLRELRALYVETGPNLYQICPLRVREDIL